MLILIYAVGFVFSLGLNYAVLHDSSKDNLLVLTVALLWPFTLPFFIGFFIGELIKSVVDDMRKVS